MASGTTIAPQSISFHVPVPGSGDLIYEAAKLATVIRAGLAQLRHKCTEDGRGYIDKEILDTPRYIQTHPRSSDLASLVASLIYPAPVSSHAPVVNYECDIATLKEALRLQERNEDGFKGDRGSNEKDRKPRWSDRILAQGPWDQIVTAELLQGVSSLPMPVEISDFTSLSPFLNHLKQGGSNDISSDTTGAQEGKEPFYELPMLEFEKGVLYADRRMDLCKMALGPPNITALMQSLRTNDFVRHFLLGNNIIGPTGARAVHDFILEFPNRIDTWYLAGNCIDHASFSLLVDALIRSPGVTNVWLKRNPLGPNSADSLFRLITSTPNLHTLDLDQTELGDAGVASLFTKLAAHVSSSPLPLKVLYISGVGISKTACEAVASYLASPHCELSSLYMSNNPIGDAGAKALATGLRENKSIQRLSIQSIGLKDDGAVPLITSLHSHPAIQTLDIGQSYSTQDLNVHFNYLTSTNTITALTGLLTAPSTPLSYLNLGPQPFSTITATPLLAAALESKYLLYLSLKPLAPTKKPKEELQYHRLEKDLSSHCLSNIRTYYNNPSMSHKEWADDLKRWCVSDKTSVRKIDSVYRNRAAQKARRGEEVLNKWLGEEDKKVVDEIMFGKW